MRRCRAAFLWVPRREAELRLVRIRRSSNPERSPSPNEPAAPSLSSPTGRAATLCLRVPLAQLAGSCHLGDGGDCTRRCSASPVPLATLALSPANPAPAPVDSPSPRANSALSKCEYAPSGALPRLLPGNSRALRGPFPGGPLPPEAACGMLCGRASSGSCDGDGAVEGR
eukprot:1194834-Prorocentrum_minimum.AAC.1